MDCCCKSGKTSEIKIEGDVSADPIWCRNCGCNLDLDESPVSAELKEKLSRWALTYGKWIDWNTGSLLANGLELEKEFNQVGLLLTEEIKHELKDQYHVSYSPSSSSSYYL